MLFVLIIFLRKSCISMHVFKQSKFSSLLLKIAAESSIFSNNLFDTILNTPSRHITVDDVPEHSSFKPCTKRSGARGGVVVKALRYKPAVRGLDSRWCHWNFSVI
jgi:hypothetical protein